MRLRKTRKTKDGCKRWRVENDSDDEYNTLISIDHSMVMARASQTSLGSGLHEGGVGL